MPIVAVTVVWDPLLSEADDQTLTQIRRQAWLDGKVLSEYPSTYPNPGGRKNNVAPMTLSSNWRSQEDAEEWAEILAQYNPQSVVIGI